MSTIPLLFNQTSSDAKKLEANASYQRHHVMKSSILRNAVRQEGFGFGGAISVAIQSHVFVTNCTFKDNSAQFMGGAIAAVYNVKLNLQGTIIVGNKALSDSGAIWAQVDVTLIVREITFSGNVALGCGGAISVNFASYLRTTNCVFDDNTSQQFGGTIIGYFSVILDIQYTSFTCNKALASGAIDIKIDVHLCVTDCTFIDNHVELVGGAVGGASAAVLQIQRTNFTSNSALQGRAINVQYQANLILTNHGLEGYVAGDLGGAILQSKCRVVRCLFHSNTAQEFGGAVLIQSKSLMQIENTNFINNKSSGGGVIYIEPNSKLQANNCNFLQNSAKQSGGAIELNYDSTAVIESCHFLANCAEAGSVEALELNNP